MINKNYLKTIDFNLIAIVLILFTMGMIMITSATDAHIVGMTREVRNQALGFVIGIIAMLLAMSFDYKTFKDFSQACLCCVYTDYVDSLYTRSGCPAVWCKKLDRFKGLIFSAS